MWDGQNSVRDATAKEFASLAHPLAQRLSDWYLDARLDAQVIAGNGVLAHLLAQRSVLATADGRDLLTQYLNSVLQEHALADIYILSNSNSRVLYPYADKTPNSAVQTPDSFRVASGQALAVVDIHREAQGGALYIDVIAPISNGSERTDFTLLMRYTPESELFPLLTIHSIYHRSLESYILRPETDSLLVLSNLRHSAQSACKLRLPMEQAIISAVQGFDSPNSLVEGRNYHDVDVLSYVTQIRGTPWWLVLECEEGEIFHGIRMKATYIGGGLLLLLVLILSGLGLRDNRRQRNQLHSAASILREYERIVQCLPTALISLDSEGRIQRMNPAACTLTRWLEKDALGKPLHVLGDFLPSDVSRSMTDYLPLPPLDFHNSYSQHEILYRQGSGTLTPMLVFVAPLTDQAGAPSGVLLIMADQREQYERQRILEADVLRIAGVVENNQDAIAVYALNPNSSDLGFEATLDLCNTSFEAILGSSKNSSFASSILDLRVTDASVLTSLMRDAWNTGAAHSVDYHDQRVGRLYIVTAFTPRTDRIALVFHDVTTIHEKVMKLNNRIEELERFNRLAVDRELRMIELKEEVNSLLRALGEKDKYRVRT